MGGVLIPQIFSNRIFSFNSAKRLVRLFTNKKKNFNRTEPTFFQELANIARGNIESCWYFFYPFMLLTISGQQK